MARSRSTFQKRDRERIQQIRYQSKRSRQLEAKERKAREKEERRIEALEAKERKSQMASGLEADPDIAGIVPGPQPLPDQWR